MNRIKAVTFLTKPGHRLEVDICAIPDWDGFDKIIQFLKNTYAAEVVSDFDGPDARRWVLTVGGSEIELQHDDPSGNTIVATSEKSQSIVRRIGEDLENRLSGL